MEDGGTLWGRGRVFSGVTRVEGEGTKSWSDGWEGEIDAVKWSNELRFR